jgi:multidrug resistance efflux pump
VGTGAVIDQQQAVVDRGQLLAALDREDVRQQLVAMGVDPKAAQERVAALSDEEIQNLNGRVQSLPAGGDILGVAVLIFLVLLLTDILGYTDIFPFVKKTVN